ncbi:MAG: hypothetical protein VB077_03345, partial [Desulfitobacterium sp.]|nr:hypothetical protein [Desulfitobacterium sp.]
HWTLSSCSRPADARAVFAEFADCSLKASASVPATHQAASRVPCMIFLYDPRDSVVHFVPPAASACKRSEKARTWILIYGRERLKQAVTKLREKPAAETGWRQDVSNRQGSQETILAGTRRG